MSPFTLTQFVGLFNVFVGLLLTLAFLLMGAASVMWVVRLGTTPTYRDEAIRLMQWAVSILFVLVLLLLVVQFVQRHTANAVYIMGFFIIALAAWAIIWAYRESAKGGEEEEH